MQAIVVRWRPLSAQSRQWPITAIGPKRTRSLTRWVLPLIGCWRERSLRPPFMKRSTP